MMKMQLILSDFKYLIITVIFLIFFTSCDEKNIYFDIPVVESKIVVNGLITPNYGIWINLSKSKHVYSSDNQNYNPVNNVIIAFYENDTFIDNIPSVGNGNYFFDGINPQPENNYKIQINSVYEEEIIAETTIPKPVEIDSIKVEVIPGSEPYIPYLTIFRCYLEFNDPVDKDNYYMISGFYNLEEDYKTMRPNSEDTDLDQDIKDKLGIVVLTDKSFNGSRKNFYSDFKVYLPQNEIYSYSFYLYSLDEDFYKYLKAYSLNGNSDDDFFIGESVLMPTNINDGLGILAGFSSSRRIFSINNLD